jgi:hypothetical protein
MRKLAAELERPRRRRILLHAPWIPRLHISHFNYAAMIWQKSSADPDSKQR